MTHILTRVELPEELHTRLKVRAATERKTFGNLIRELLEAAAKEKPVEAGTTRPGQ